MYLRDKEIWRMNRTNPRWNQSKLENPAAVCETAFAISYMVKNKMGYN